VQIVAAYSVEALSDGKWSQLSVHGQTIGALLIDILPSPMADVSSLRFNCSSALGQSQPVRLMNPSGACLGIPSNASYPCWTGGDGPFSLCPLVATTDCSAATSTWSVPAAGNVGFWSTAGSPAQVINVDCDACAIGTHAKLISGVHYGSSLEWDDVLGQIRVSGCPGMCLTNGSAAGALPSCAGNEPWFTTQVHVDSCTAASTHGWTLSPVGPAPSVVNVTIAALGAYLQVSPAGRPY
jgi:hypothetical protein